MANYDVFGLQKLEVYDSSTSAWRQIPGVENASFEETAETVEVKGDDTIVATWRHAQKGELKWKANIIDFDVLEILTGETATSEMDGGESIPGMTATTLYPRNLCFRLTQMAKRRSDGEFGTLVTTIYKVQGFAKVTGQSYGEPSSLEFEGTALPTDKDELGQALPKVMGYKQRFIPS